MKKYIIAVCIILIVIILSILIIKFFFNKNSNELYTLSFNSNGGSEVGSITLSEDSPLTLPIPEKAGHTFIGWYRDATLTVKFTNNTMPNSNKTLYAKWEINKYTITFNSNGGSLVNPITQEYNSNVNKPIDPTKLGYSFIGWYSDINLTYKYDFTTMPLNNIILFAKWEVKQPSIIFDSVGGSIVDSIHQDYNTIITSPAHPVKSGYTFGGWYLDNKYTQKFGFNTMPLETITLYAKWDLITEGLIFEISDNKYTVIGYQGTSTEVIIPELYYNFPVIGISSKAFENSTITKIFISKNITTYVGVKAIFNINSLTTIEVDEENAYFSSVDGVIFNKDKTILYKYPKAKADNHYSIPNTVIETFSEAFLETKVESVFIPNSLEKLGESTFAKTSNLITVIFEDNCKITKFENNLFYQSNIKELTIPNSVAIINNNVFNGANGLITITIPNSVTIIGNYAFSSTRNLTEIIFEENSQLNKIGFYSFQDAISLKRITIPKNVTELKVGVFKNANKLEEIIFEPDSQLTMISYRVFENTKSLKSITFLSITPPVITELILPSSTVIYVPLESLDLYKQAEGWSLYANRIQPIIS